MSFETALGAPVVAQTPAQGSIPDLRGTWKGESESVVFGAGAHPHHGGAPREDASRFTSKPFTMTIDKQDGRRFSGTFSSERSTETVIGVVSRSRRVIGDGLHARTDQRQATEMNVAVMVLNRILELGRPKSVRIA